VTAASLGVAALAAAVIAGGLVYALRGSGPPPRPATARPGQSSPARPGTPAPATPSTPPTPTAPTSPGWQAVWTAGFGGPAGGGIDRGVWRFDTGTGVFGTHEIETMTDSAGNVHVDGQDGLDITALRNGSPAAPSAWTSGRIQTRRLFGAPPGQEMLVTASIRQPDPAQGSGYWPGFWMLGPGQWPKDGEIDILEDENAQSTHSGTLHCGNLYQPNGDGTFGPCHEGYGFGSGRLPCPGCQTGFHTYSVIIDRRNEARQQIRWYFDGAEFFSVSEAAVGTATWTAAVDHGFSIILDVAMGGSYPDAVCQCVSPNAQTSSGATMTVRQLAVYVS
jgi:beta-glucanase (GH16 family)